MSRTIKFRGRNNKASPWVYGYVVFDDPDKAVIFQDGIECDVDVESVGEFTGLLDRNGKEIYEGDVARFVFNGRDLEEGVIEWHEDMFHIRSLKYPNLSPGNYRLAYIASRSEIIGNIYENPELVK